MDALVGVSFLTGTGHTEIALVGHSFGGAVVITAAPYSEDVKAVAALSSQTFGARGADKVSPRPLLLAHGGSDSRLPPYCSEQIYSWAKQPKELVLYPGAEHGLVECAEEMREMLAGWSESIESLMRKLHKSHYCSVQSAAMPDFEANHPHPNLPPSRGRIFTVAFSEAARLHIESGAIYFCPTKPDISLTSEDSQWVNLTERLRL